MKNLIIGICKRKKVFLLVLSFAFFLLIGRAVITFADNSVVTLISPSNESTSKNLTNVLSCSATNNAGLQTVSLNYGKVVEVTKKFQNDGTMVNTVNDSQMVADYPNTNYGTDTSVNIDALAPHSHFVIKFPNVFGTDANQIPLESEISSASITANCFDVGGTLTAYALKEDWKESEVTWNERMTGVPWSNPGADGTISRDSQSMSWSCSSIGVKTYDVTNLVKNWSNGTPNYGIVVIDNSQDGVDYYSSNDTTVSNRPNLNVTYKTVEDWGIKQTQVVSGTNVTADFQTNLEDKSTYKWNCEATDVLGQKSVALIDSVLNIDSSLNIAPNQPTLVSPLNGLTIASNSAPLEISVSDPESNQMEVTYYGREAGTQRDDFTIIALPDTQHYSSGTLGIFSAQTQWIANQKAARNIVAVSHQGDVVDVWNDTTQYSRANTAMSILDGVVPYSVLPGNHDISSARAATYYNQTFPFSRYSSESWYGGNYPVGSNENNYILFSAGGMEYLLISLIYCPTNDVLNWANQIISQYPNRQVIISTHGYLDSTAQRNVHVPSGGCTAASANTQYLWDNLIYPNNKTFMVLSGHVNGEARRTDLNMGGNSVHQLLADFQNSANGGDGWLRIMTFKPAENKIYVETYSPYQNKYDTDADSQFTLDFNMNGFSPIGTVSNVASGSNAQMSWLNLNSGTSYEWYASAKDSSGKVTVSPVWSFATEQGNQVPVSNGGADQIIIDADNNGSEIVTLNGAASIDIDGSIAQYSWKEGTQILGSTSIINPTFTTGIHIVTLTVTDNEGLTNSDTVTITIKPSIVNQNLIVTSGYDSRTKSSINSTLVNSSNNLYQKTDKVKYATFKFENANVPVGAVIKSVVVYVEHREDSGFKVGDIQWEIGTGWPNSGVIWGKQIAVPIKTTDTLESWDVTSLVNSSTKVNTMELKVLNNNRYKSTYTDYVYAVINYSL